MLEQEYGFLDLSEYDSGVLTIPAGTYQVERTVVIPKGFELHIQSGTNFLMGPHVSLVSYSPVVADGDDHPILFERLMPDEAFGVVAVVSDTGTSLFDTMIIAGGSEAKVNEIYFSGTLSIHGGAADIFTSEFIGNNAEDAVNIKNATSTLISNTFRDNSGDGLDLDSVSARIENNIFENNANDAIDSGSSEVEALNNMFSGSKNCLKFQESSVARISSNGFVDCGTKVYLDGTSELSTADDSI